MSIPFLLNPQFSCDAVRKTCNKETRQRGFIRRCGKGSTRPGAERSGVPNGVCAPIEPFHWRFQSLVRLPNIVGSRSSGSRVSRRKHKEQPAVHGALATAHAPLNCCPVHESIAPLSPIRGKRPGCPFLHVKLPDNVLRSLLMFVTNWQRCMTAIMLHASVLASVAAPIGCCQWAGDERGMLGELARSGNLGIR